MVNVLIDLFINNAYGLGLVFRPLEQPGKGPDGLKGWIDLIQYRGPLHVSYWSIFYASCFSTNEKYNSARCMFCSSRKLTYLSVFFFLNEVTEFLRCSSIKIDLIFWHLTQTVWKSLKKVLQLHCFIIKRKMRPFVMYFLIDILIGHTDTDTYCNQVFTSWMTFPNSAHY